MTRIRFPLALMVATVAALACGRKEAEMPADSAAAAPAPPPAVASVTTIETGKTIDANRRVMDTTSTFSPRDTIFISVVTANAGPTTTLKTLVTFQDGQVVDSTSQTVQAGPSTVTEFHLVKAGGWPTGDYTVDVQLDGQSVGTRRLTVRR